MDMDIIKSITMGRGKPVQIMSIYRWEMLKVNGYGYCYQPGRVGIVLSLVFQA